VKTHPMTDVGDSPTHLNSLQIRPPPRGGDVINGPTRYPLSARRAIGRTAALKREDRLYRGTGLHVGDCLVDVLERVRRHHLIEGEASALVEVEQLWDE
jgi:hypothetical protein